MTEKMTYFEELANEMGIKIETDKYGMYKGMCRALALCCTEITLSDDEKVFYSDWNNQKEIIKEKFYKLFPYMKK